MSAAHVGIDIGGTFTDLVFRAADGRILRSKVLSTPADYARGIVDGLESGAADDGVRAARVSQIVHGTTVATNAVLEAKGTRVALITTEGFRDVLEIRRLRMPVLYDIRFRKPPALVPRRLRFEVPERIDAAGKVVRPLDVDAARRTIDAILAERVEVLAICLINAYASGVHERALRDLVRARDAAIPVCLSSDILPEMREYERTSTTVVNAYVLPLVRSYLAGLQQQLRERGIVAPLTVMQSSGGAMSAAAASERPIHIIESGPAAGVVGAAEFARRLGNVSLLSFDMGGTTAKAALIDRGRFLRVNALEVGGGINVAGRLLSGGGYHVRAPAIDIAEVGAGGGSLARLDAGGGLRVGPESAGAAPGPVCYDRGGSVPTVTDANVVLGFVNPEALAGGGLRIRRDLAVRAIEESIARPLGLTVEEAAWGVHRVANAAMARALRAVSTERGVDPRELAIFAFGGNGPVHAGTLARLLDLRRILVPPLPGLFSALGMLFPQTEHHYVRTHKRPLDALDAAALEADFTALEAEGREALAADGFTAASHRFDRLVDLRYAGANSEITVPLPATATAGALCEAFAQAHERQFGYRSDEERVETMSVRVIARGVRESSLAGDGLRFPEQRERSRRTRAVHFGPEVGSLDTPVCGRGDIGTAWRAGPVLIEEFDSTTVVPPDGRVRRIGWDSLEIELE